MSDQERIEDTIQNGVKETNFDKNDIHLWVEDAIQNGVIYTNMVSTPQLLAVEDTIQNGVKKTNVSPTFTEYGDWLDGDERLDDIIKNGIKETWGYEKQPQIRVDEVIEGGIKETNWRKVDNHPTYLENILKNKD